MGRKIGVYGGTFDPVHLGHVNLAVEIMEAHSLDQVWFCPASINPHKNHQPINTESRHRLEMLQLAIEGQSDFRIIDLELRRSGPSFMIDTLRTLAASEANRSDPDKFFLIIGEDAAKSFFSWREPEEILGLASLLVGTRTPSLLLENLQGSPVIQEAIRKGTTPTRRMEISSTEIRQRLSKKLYCGHLLQRKVLDYILANHLYCTAASN